MKCGFVLAVILLSSAPAVAQVETPSPPLQRAPDGSKEPPRNPRGQPDRNDTGTAVRKGGRVEMLIGGSLRECDAFGCYWDRRTQHTAPK
jgi:hypothetical protein